jgi:peptide deformylase
MYSILPEEKNPALRETARDIPIVEIAASKTKRLIAEMKELLANEEYGVALAAPQVGEPLRLFIVSGRALARDSRNTPDEPGHEDTEEEDIPPLPDQVYINPKMTKLSRGRTGKHEGCLSIRGKWGIVPRAEKATVRAYDETGRAFTRGASGFLAHVFQHEMDHLEGVLYTDKASELYDEAPDAQAREHDE